MKRFILMIFLIIFIILLLPTIIVLIFMVKPQTSEGPDSNAQSVAVTVLHHNTGEIESVDLEEYLSGVLAGEMPASFHIEALKAQAVAARTYILDKKETHDPSHPNADICTDSTHCKAWLSEEETRQKFGEEWGQQYAPKIKEAVFATAGQVMLYDEKPITAVFHSTGSGRTENSEDIWGGEVPYLKSVESPGDTLSPKFNSEKIISKEEFSKLLSDYRETDVDAEIGQVEYTQGGSVKTINIGGADFRGTEIRSIFSLSSSNFTIEDSGDNLVFHVKGSGHGVGLSQYGAEFFAQNGKMYDEILKIYYQGVEIVNYY